eukprot:9178779-Prorocentrum_lima.AAC.1
MGVSSEERQRGGRLPHAQSMGLPAASSSTSPQQQQLQQLHEVPAPTVETPSSARGGTSRERVDEAVLSL